MSITDTVKYNAKLCLPVTNRMGLQYFFLEKEFEKVNQAYLWLESFSNHRADESSSQMEGC
jgi:hypothetical protein